MNYKNDKALPVNEQIKASRLQVINEHGENLGVITREEALRTAREADLDLVVMTERGKESVPIAKITDYGKILYAKKKKLSEAKKHQKTIQIKEIKIRPKIGEHDYQTKIKQAAQFLKAGKHVKVTLVFRGREMATIKERAIELFDRIVSSFAQLGCEVTYEKDAKAGTHWSRVYTLKR